MDQQQQILQRLQQALEDSVDNFNKDIPAAQERILMHVLELTKELNLKDGIIDQTSKNYNLIIKIRAELSSIVVDPKYIKSVREFTASFDTVTTLQNQYFASLSSTFGVKKLFESITAESIDSTIASLSKQGIQVNVTDKLADILKQNVTGGGTYKDFVKQLNVSLTNTDKGDGLLSSYTKTYVTDALFQYSRNYHQAVSDDLGFEWYSYIGGEQDTTRPFCHAMLQAKASCMRYFHKSQIAELIKGRICSGNVPLNDKTKLPAGFKKDTNVSNFLTYLGGWGCKHTYGSVPASVVPKELRNALTSTSVT